VSFDYSSDATREIQAFFKRTGKVIVHLTVREILDEQITMKLASSTGERKRLAESVCSRSRTETNRESGPPLVRRTAAEARVDRCGKAAYHGRMPCRSVGIVEPSPITD
jgi:hypothetical protein